MTTNLQNLRKAAYLWNHHTNPMKLRSEFDHSIHSKAAKKIMSFIDRNFTYKHDYTISDSSGRILPICDRIYVDQR